MVVRFKQIQSLVRDSGRVSHGVERKAPNGAITSIVVDVAIPLALYYLLHDGFGVGMVMATVYSSIVPLLRTVFVGVRDRKLETLAALMLTLNLASIVIGLLSGDARLMFAREAAISSIVGLWAIGSVVAHRTPLFAQGFEAFATRGDVTRTQVWQRLTDTDPGFRQLLARHTMVWGVVLLADSVLRVLVSMTMPVNDLPLMLMGVNILSGGVAVTLSGAVAAARAQRMFERACRVA